jgi:hypothetical protein
MGGNPRPSAWEAIPSTPGRARRYEHAERDERETDRRVAVEDVVAHEWPVRGANLRNATSAAAAANVEPLLGQDDRAKGVEHELECPAFACRDRAG